MRQGIIIFTLIFASSYHLQSQLSGNYFFKFSTLCHSGSRNSNGALSSETNYHRWALMFACHDLEETSVVSMSLRAPTPTADKTFPRETSEQTLCVGIMPARPGSR